LKPSLLGNVTDVMARLRKAKADVVFSSALETAVGARSALRVAFAWNGEAIVAAAKTPAPSKAGHVRALGFGVWPLFADSQFDGPAGVAFLRSDDIARVNAEAVWNALR
jgi:O-succinylbenzoate synthase